MLELNLCKRNIKKKLQGTFIVRLRESKKYLIFIYNDLFKFKEDVM